MSLADDLRALLAEARRDGKARVTLKHGLSVHARTGPDRLLLYRTTGNFSGAGGEREGTVCANALGWVSVDLAWTTREGRHYLTVTRLGSEAAPTPAPEIPEALRGLRALTLTHPWPHAILELGKRVENRSWAPPRHLVGQLVALHGGRMPRSPGDFAAVRADALAIVNDIVPDDTGDPEMEDADLPDEELARLCIPGIFAVARVARVVTTSDSPWFFGPFGWELEELVRIDPPVPHKGAQGVWPVEESALRLVAARWQAARGEGPAAPAEGLLGPGNATAAPSEDAATPPPIARPHVGPDRCGSCVHWTPQDATLGACGLGWRAHDGYPRSSNGKDEAHFPHPIPVPLTSFGSRCWVEDGWRAAR